MKIVTNIAIPDFVYRFYMQVATDLGDRTPEDVMADALFTYAGLVAQDILISKQPSDSKIVQFNPPNPDNQDP